MNAALALAVGLIGAVLAWVALYVHWVVAAAVLVIFVILGVALFMHGKSTIRSAPKSRSAGWKQGSLSATVPSRQLALASWLSSAFSWPNELTGARRPTPLLALSAER